VTQFKAVSQSERLTAIRDASILLEYRRQAGACLNYSAPPFVSIRTRGPDLSSITACCEVRWLTQPARVTCRQGTGV